MGTLSGTAEVFGETFSLENIKGLTSGQTKGLLKDILRSAGIEGSEEGVTTLLNTFADNIVNGNESDYYVALEGYISQGMSYADAERAAMKDWVNGIAFDMISGAASGGISGGVGGPAVRAADSLMSGRKTFEGDTQGLLDTAAGFKDTKAADLATKYGTKYSGKGYITNRQAGKLGTAIEKATGQQNETNIHNAISAELKVRGVTSNTGDLSDAIQKSASGKLLTKEEHYLIRDTPGAREIRDELFDRMANGKLDAEKLAAEDTPQWLKNIEQKNGAVVAGQAMFGSLQNEAAEQRLTEADRIDTINPEVTIGEVSGKVSGISSSGNTAEITITGKDGTKRNVNLEEAISSGAIPNDVAYLARNAAAFGPVANEVYNLYSPAQTAREYIAAMDAAINTVAANVGSWTAFQKADSVQYLTKEQKQFAWSQGQQKRTQAQEKDGGKKTKPKKKTPPRTGRVSYGGVSYEGRTFKATSEDKVKPEARRVLEKFAAATGVDIVFYESEADQRWDYVGANGFYRNGTVYLDVHAGAKNTTEKEAVLVTAAHEFTHFIRENTPRRYNQLKEFVTEHLLENGYDFETLVERKIKAAQKEGGLSRDAAVEEVVADACEMVFSSSKAVERLAKEKPGLAKRIADWLHEFFDDIRKAFAGVEARHEEARAMLDSMDELTRLWDDALVEAAENRNYQIRKSSINEGAESAQTKYQLREYSEQQIENWSKSKRIVIYTGETQMRQFIADARGDTVENKKMYFGMVPHTMAKAVLSSTGLDVEGFNCSISAYEIRKIFKDHGNQRKEEQRGQRAITEDDIVSIPDILLNADRIELSPKLYNGKPAISFVKHGNDRVTVTAYVSDKHLDLVVQTMFANIKKGNLATPTDVQASVNTPEANHGTVSSNSIRNSDQNVKKSRRENPTVTKTEMASNIIQIVEEDDRYGYYGLRVGSREHAIGETLENSHQLFQDQEYDEEGEPIYPDGEGPYAGFYDAGELDGTSAIAIDDYNLESSVPRGLDRLKSYIPGKSYIYLVRGDGYSTGHDTGEHLIQNAEVIAKWTINEDGTYLQETAIPESTLFSRRDSAEGLTKEEARAQAASYTRLKAENAALQRRLEYWRGQTRRTKQATVRQTDVNRFARALVKRYASTADQAYIRQALQEMGDYLVQNTGEALDYEQLHQMAVTVAAELVATAEVTEEDGYTADVADDILSSIRNADIKLDRQYLKDLPEGFRRDFRGKLHIFTDKGRSVDSIYAELQETFGYDLFPAIDNPADQVVMMGDIFDRLNAPAEVNPRPPRGGRRLSP